MWNRLYMYRIYAIQPFKTEKIFFAQLLKSIFFSLKNPPQNWVKRKTRNSSHLKLHSNKSPKKSVLFLKLRIISEYNTCIRPFSHKRDISVKLILYIAGTCKAIHFYMVQIDTGASNQTRLYIEITTILLHIVLIPFCHSLCKCR